METYDNRAPRRGDRIVPLNGGKHRRNQLGTPLTVGEVNWKEGIIYAAELSCETHGWHIDPRAHGKRRSRPYISMKEPYVVGFDDAGLERLRRLCERKAEVRRDLRKLIAQRETEIDSKFMRAAAKLQRAFSGDLEVNAEHEAFSPAPKPTEKSAKRLETIASPP